MTDAYTCAYLATLVYRNDVKTGDEHVGGRILAVGTAGRDSEWLIWIDDTRLIVAIRGSETPWGSFVDWIGNLFAWPINGVHGGFALTAAAVLDDMGSYLDAWRNQRQVTFTGHSRGAGACLVVAAWMPAAFGTQYCVFAAPRSVTRRMAESMRIAGVDAHITDYLGDSDLIRRLLHVCYTRVGTLIELPGVTHRMADYLATLTPPPETHDDAADSL